MIDYQFKNPKITIKGDFWDSYLYRDCLFLFSVHGNVDVFDWSYLIQRQASDNNLLGLKCSFLNSDYLYKIRSVNLFKDKDLLNLVKQKINRLTDITINLNEVIKKCSFELDQAPIDIGFYNNIFFYIDSRGFYQRECKFKNKNVVSKNEKLIYNIQSQN